MIDYKELKKFRQEEGLTLEEIGKRFGVTGERIRQLCKKLQISRKLPEPDIAKMLTKKTSYPSNIVGVSSDGHLVFLNDGSNNWVEVHNKRLRESIKEIYQLQSWIE